MPYLLDTCAWSEFMVKTPDPNFIAALQAIPEESQFVSVITLGELESGIESLPPSAWRTRLTDWFHGLILAQYHDRILPVDANTALAWGSLAARLRRAGLTMHAADALIAATAIQHGLTIITRNEKHFANCGVTTYNPWSSRRQ